MGRKTKRYFVPLLAAMLVMAALLPMSALAAENPLRITVAQTAPAGHSFTYRLESIQPGNPMPDGSTAEGYTFSLSGNNSIQLPPMRFTRENIYQYKVSQVVEEEKLGYTYDRRVYSIKVHVDASLGVIVLVFNENGIKVGDIAFENGYRVLPSDPKLMQDPPVRKIVTGNPPRGATFEFKLVAMEKSYPMPAGSANGEKTIRIEGAGEGEFGTWVYDTAGTYKYTVMEVNTGQSGYVFDTTVYTITDTVADVDGRLSVSRVVKNNYNNSSTALVFLNQYSEGKPGPTPTPKPESTPGPGPGPGPTPDTNGKTDPGGGKPGPKTGDDTETALLYTLLSLGGATALGAAIYLIAGKKRKKTGE